MNMHTVYKLASDNNTISPSTYGKKAYAKYRKKERYKEQSRSTLGRNYHQRRTKIVTDTHYAKIVAQLLKELQFPADKNEIIDFILNIKFPTVISREQAVDVLSLIQQAQEKKYKTVADVTEAIELLQDIS